MNSTDSTNQRWVLRTKQKTNETRKASLHLAGLACSPLLYTTRVPPRKPEKERKKKRNQKKRKGKKREDNKRKERQNQKRNTSTLKRRLLEKGMNENGDGASFFIRPGNGISPQQPPPPMSCDRYVITRCTRTEPQNYYNDSVLMPLWHRPATVSRILIQSLRVSMTQCVVFAWLAADNYWNGTKSTMMKNERENGKYKLTTESVRDLLTVIDENENENENERLSNNEIKIMGMRIIWRFCPLHH